MDDRSEPVQEKIACRRARRARRPHSDDQADGHQGEDQHSNGHMDEQNADLLRIGIGHRRQQEEAGGEHRDDQHGKQPVQYHQQRMIAGHQRRFHVSPAARSFPADAVSPVRRRGCAYR